MVLAGVRVIFREGNGDAAFIFRVQGFEIVALAAVKIGFSLSVVLAPGGMFARALKERFEARAASW